MRDDRRLIDALDVCIERLRHGGPLDQILQDYPDDADRLRDLLQIARTAEQINFADHTVADAQSAVWSQLDTHPRQNRRRFRLVLRLTAAALALAIISVISLSLLFSAEGIPLLELESQLTATSISAMNATTVGYISATQTVERIIQSPSSMPPPSSTVPPSTISSQPSLTFTPSPLPSATPISSPAGIIVTSVAGMEGGTATRDPNITPLIGPTLTPLPDIGVPIVGEMTATARVIGGEVIPTLQPPIVTATALPTIEVNAVALTATALGNLLQPTALADSQGGGIQTIAPDEIALTATALQHLFPSFATLQALTSVAPLPTQPVQLPDLEPLNAGSINDNTNFDDYLLYRRNFQQRYPGFNTDVDVTIRQIITVTDSAGFPVANAIVRLFAADKLVWQARTYADGRTLFFPNATAETRASTVFQVIVTYADTAVTFTLDLRDGPMWRVTLPITTATARQAPKLDVLFLIDSTGSMADEIYELQTNVLRISEQVAELDAATNYSFVTYRDAGDAYELQVVDFTSDVSAFQINLSRLRADGGGDYPESLNRAFDTTVNNVTWRDDAIKLVFLIADAAPHFRDQHRYDVTALEALREGIKVYTLASSGLDQLGEYIFRQISQLTFGQFLFLTYDDSNPQVPGVQPGTPGDDRPDLEAGDDPADFTVEQLDELILRLIEDEIAALRTPLEQQ